MRIIPVLFALQLCSHWLTPYAAASEVLAVQSSDDLQAKIKKTGAKVVLFNVWGITCSPCLAEMPVLTRIYNQFKDNKNVSILGLCILDEKMDQKAAVSATTTVVHKKQLEYCNFVWMGRSEALLEKYPMQGTPYNALLKPDGSVTKEIDRLPKDPEKAFEFLVNEINAALKTP